MFLLFLFFHWIADFVFQTDWQAKNKSSNNRALFDHVFIYSITMSISYIAIGAFFHLNMSIAFLFFTFVTHFVTDYVTSRINTRLWSKGDVHNFFVSVGFDQFIHACTLYGTILFLNGYV